jgi:anti-anti-sigma factor
MSHTPYQAVQLRTSDGVLVLSVAAGQLASIETVSRFERELRQLTRERDENRWLIDFGNTTFFITPAVNTLLLVLRTLRERGGKLVLTGVSQDVRYVLGLMRVDRVITISPSISCAMAELGGIGDAAAGAAGAG